MALTVRALCQNGGKTAHICNIRGGPSYGYWTLKLHGGQRG